MTLCLGFFLWICFQCPIPGSQSCLVFTLCLIKVIVWFLSVFFLVEDCTSDVLRFFILHNTFVGYWTMIAEFCISNLFQCHLSSFLIPEFMQHFRLKGLLVWWQFCIWRINNPRLCIRFNSGLMKTVKTTFSETFSSRYLSVFAFWKLLILVWKTLVWIKTLVS